ncbi:MAG: hypothetical protein JW818_09905 [Pirellulales bacterium]|nr:hypothetical protein [Pirellulales bacterium]
MNLISSKHLSDEGIDVDHRRLRRAIIAIVLGLCAAGWGSQPAQAQLRLQLNPFARPPAAAPAAVAPLSSVLAHHAQRYFTLQISDGRIVANALRRSSFSTSNTSIGTREQLSIQNRGNTPGMQLSYNRTTATDRLDIQIGPGSLQIKHDMLEKDAKTPSVDFVQVGREPMTLTLRQGEKKVVYRAATIWHLMFAHGDICQQYLNPYLKTLQPNWDLTKQVKEIEAALLAAARSNIPPNRDRWAELVAQLGDSAYGQREAADRELRKAGRRVVHFLENLNPDDLDAEQQMRIRRIINSLSRQEGDDSPRDVALEMLDDPMIWLALLGREDQSTRETAAKRLRTLLNRDIAFDPAADAPTRAKQIAELRKQLGHPSDTASASQ